jgi:hypothetical protein
MYTEDRYYEPEDCDYPDDFEWKIEQYAFELLNDECNYITNWNEGVSECGYDDSEYPTPTHAPVKVIEQVTEYWYNVAMTIATNYYEENPYND